VRFPRPDEAALAKERILAVQQSVATLPENEEEVITLLFGLAEPEVSGAELARNQDLHRSAIIRRSRRAIGRLKWRLRAHA
jgi:DNA-directed RNA polymerase specialized sigma subunit